MERQGGELQLIQRNGAPAPGTTENFHLSSFALNTRGQTAVFGFVGDSNGQQGIWATNLAGDLIHVAHTGGALDVDPGDGINLKTVDELHFSGVTGNGDGRPSLFNNQGELAFFAGFTDGTEGIFISRAVAVPEPTSTELALFALAAVIPAKTRLRSAP